MSQIVCVLYCGEYITRLNRFLERCLIIPGNVGWSRACNVFGHLLYISSFSKSFIYCIIINKTGSYTLNNAKILTCTINSRLYTVENRNADQIITWLLANVPNTQSRAAATALKPHPIPKPPSESTTLCEEAGGDL